MQIISGSAWAFACLLASLRSRPALTASVVSRDSAPVGGSVFSAEVWDSSQDLQGYPFASQWSLMDSRSENWSDSWMQHMCFQTECALVAPASRRLAETTSYSSNDYGSATQAVKDKLQAAADMETVQAFINIATAFSSGAFLFAGVVANAILSIFIAGAQDQAMKNFVKGVNQKYAEIAKAINGEASEVAARVGLSSIRDQLRKVRAFGTELGTANRMDDASSAIKRSCDADQGTSILFLSLVDVSSTKETMRNAYVTRATAYLNEAISYANALAVAYTNYIQCELAYATDQATIDQLRSNDASHRKSIVNAIVSLANVADEIKSSFKSSDLDAKMREAYDDDWNSVASTLSNTYDWLTFSAGSFPDDCPNQSAGRQVFNVDCGVWTLNTGSGCKYVTWISKTNKDATEYYEKSSTANWKTYSSYGDEMCGFITATTTITSPSSMPKLMDARDIWVRSSKYAKATTPPVTVQPAATLTNSSKTLDASADVSSVLNAFADEQMSVNDAISNYNASELAKSIKSKDLAVWAGTAMDLKVISDAHTEEIKAIDGTIGTVLEVHGIEMKLLNGVSDDLDTTGSAEITAMKNLESQTTQQHTIEMTGIKNLDGSLDTLSSSLQTGFSDASKYLNQVYSDTTQKLTELSGTISSVGANTRASVKQVVDNAAKLTTDRLNSLSDLIATTNQQKVSGIDSIASTVSETNQQARQDIIAEFTARQVQLKDRLAGVTNQLVASARISTNALVSETDSMRTDLGRKIAFVSDQITVINDRITTIEKGVKVVETQVDEIIQFVYQLNTKLSSIYRSIKQLPSEIRHDLKVANVEEMFRQASHLSFAYSNYIKHNMNQLQAFEFLRACEVSKYDALFDNLRHQANPANVIQDFSVFDYNRRDYERFGNSVIGAAYHLRYLLPPCANMVSLKETGEALIDAEGSREYADQLNEALWRFQLNIEEVIPRYFVTQRYTALVLNDALDTQRRKWNNNGSFHLGAIEPLRYQLQDDVGAFTTISVINVDVPSKLQVWSSSASAGSNANRYGFVNTPKDLLVLWGNTPKQLPAYLQKSLQIDLPDSLTTSSLSSAFQGSIWQAYWDHGLVRIVVRVEKIDKVCPWAIADAAYPYCWAGSGSVCYCIQLEGIPDSPSTQEMTVANQVPTYYTLYTTMDNVNGPRSDFLISASIDAANASDVLLGANKMRGVPSNRLSYSICMSSAKPHQVCDISDSSSTWCHQPPPQFKRCISDSDNAFDIVYSNSSGADVFIKTGLSVTDTMFRTMEVGATVPEITFFDAQHGAGNYVVCTDCSMADFKTVYMFRIMSFKVGRPQLETTVVCTRHPRLSNVEFCPMSPDTPALWTPQVLLNTEMTQRVKQVGSQLESGLTDPQAIASKINDGLQELIGTSFAFFKVYIAQEGSFNATLNPNGYWTSLPNETATQERGWSPVPAVYSTTINDTATVFDALVMWSTLAVEERNLAELVVKKKPNGSSLKAYLASAFSEYSSERILRGHFAEKFIGLDCPVAGDTDHFAYCTPEPVDGLCMCVQLEDLPEEYTELYSGKAPNGKVVSYAMTDAIASPYVVGRSKGAFSLNGKTAAQTINGFPARNVSEISLCLSNVNHPELGATCISETNTDFALRSNATTTGSTKVEYMGDSNVVVGAKVASVQVQSESWVALCKGCTSEFVAQIVRFSKGATTVTLGGLTAGSMCQHSAAEGGGDLYVCLN